MGKSESLLGDVRNSRSNALRISRIQIGFGAAHAGYGNQVAGNNRDIDEIISVDCILRHRHILQIQSDLAGR